MSTLADRIDAIMKSGALWQAVDDANGTPTAFCILANTVAEITGKPEDVWTLEDMRGWFTEVDAALGPWQRPGHSLIAYWRPDAIFVVANRVALESFLVFEPPKSTMTELTPEGLELMREVIANSECKSPLRG
jgi:hypothetical protein